VEDDPDWAQLLDQPHDTPSTRRTVRLTGSWSGIGAWLVGPVVLLLIAALVAVNLPSAIGAALGHGTRGTFTAVQYNTSAKGGGVWTGTFKPANNGSAVTDVTFNGLSGVQPGSVVPALYNGGQAYTVHGSTYWLRDVLILLVIAGMFVAWCLRIPLRHVRQRGSVPPPPWARTT
jgi:hypothetical protein